MNKKPNEASQINSKANAVCFVAGRSGGHLIPALTLAKKLKDKNSKVDINFFTTNTRLDQKILNENNFIDTFIFLNLKNIPYKRLLRYPIFFTNLTISFFKSFFRFIKKRPQKVISMGGYISIPVCLAAFILRVPIELFELNSSPGKAIKFLSPFASTIYICFKKAAENLPKKKCKLRDYPIRFVPSQINVRDTKEKCTILVLGGSQGSIEINSLVKKWILKNKQLNKQISIVHQTGANDTTDWRNFYNQLDIPAVSFDFKKNIKKYYHDSDIVICRAGAGTLFETVFFNKKCITIPLETSTTAHQVDNAREISKLYPKLVTMIRKETIDKNVDAFFDQLNSMISKKIKKTFDK